MIPNKVKGVPKDTPARVVITDIYQGLDGIKRGEVKYLRILETYSKTVRTTPQRCDVGVGSGWDVRGVLGIVPVEADGSAHFYLSPYKQIFFEALAWDREDGALTGSSFEWMSDIDGFLGVFKHYRRTSNALKHAVNGSNQSFS